MTHKERPGEEGQPLVDVEQVHQHQEQSDQKLQARGSNVLGPVGHAEANESHKRGPLDQKKTKQEKTLICNCESFSLV